MSSTVNLPERQTQTLSSLSLSSSWSSLALTYRLQSFSVPDFTSCERLSPRRLRHMSYMDLSCPMVLDAPLLLVNELQEDFIRLSPDHYDQGFDNDKVESMVRDYVDEDVQFLNIQHSNFSDGLFHVQGEGSHSLSLRTPCF